jgi:hypothetical protein
MRLMIDARPNGRFSVAGFSVGIAGGLNPPVVCLTPQTRFPGGQFQPPAVVNDAESPVCNANDNE